MKRLVFAAVLLAGLAGLAGCGDRPDPEGVTSPEPGRAGKRSEAVGTLEARVVERPSHDRARIEAEWKLRPGASACELHFVLPDGALLVEGQDVEALPDAGEGRAGWLVEFPVGRPLDAVLRLCAETPAGHRAIEVYVRLTD